jgi:hypothetical protein
MAIEPILWGVALAATAGLRVFMPFLFVGGMARYAHTPAPGILEWTASDAGFFLLLTASVLEVLGDKLPVVDHALDAVATFIKPAAGFLLPAALLYDVSPAGAWVLGIAAGAPLALGVHATKAGTRAASTATTMGTGNPVVSVVEDVFAVAILVFTVIAPFVAVALIALLVVLVVRAVSRMWKWFGRRRPDNKTPASSGGG